MKIKTTSHLKYIILICIFVISAIVGTIILNTRGVFRNTSNDITGAYTTVENENIINVNISGEVKIPGRYTVTKYCTIADIINISGGLTDNADTSEMDLTDVLYDGQSVIIPRKSKTNTSSQIKDKVNINTASAAELEALPGIGNTYSAAIISYRNRYGKFEIIEDIMNVDGIGEKRFDEIKDYICTGTERME